MKLKNLVAVSAVALCLAAGTPAWGHVLKICKKSDPAGPVTGTFTFSVNGVMHQVDVGECKSLSNPGTAPITIVEQAVAGVVVSAINVSGDVSGVTANPATRTVTFTIAKDGSATVEFCNKAKVKGRFTGGGSILTGEDRVTHGFELHCKASEEPNNLEINFAGNQFHLEDLVTATCTVDPETGVATITGTGTGRFNGVEGYTIQFTLTDAGEPGTEDFASFVITSPDDVEVLNVAGNLEFGNHQFHPEKKD